jgi:hypothetical protein
MSRARTAIFAIHELLEAERACILSADFSAVSALSVRKEHLFQELAKNALPDKAVLIELTDKTNANQRLLAASLRGIKAATSRLELLLSGGKSLNIYDKSGSQHAPGAPKTATLEKRA